MSDAEKIKDNHERNLMANLFNLCHSNWGYDCKITAGNRSFDVHRLILAAFSERFREMLDSAGSREEIHLDMDGDILEVLVHFMYRGEAEVNADNCEGLLAAAESFELKAVRQSCSNFLNTLTPDNSLFVRRLRRKFQFREELPLVNEFIAQNYRSIRTNGDFVAITKDELVEILTEVELSSEDLWDAIVAWTCSDRESRLGHFADIFSLCVDKFSMAFMIRMSLKKSATSSPGFAKRRFLSEVFSNLDRFKSSINVDNFTDLITLCRSFQHDNSEEAKKLIIEFIKDNLQSIADTDSATNLLKEDVFCLFQASSEQAGCEKASWTFLLKWTKHSEKRKAFFPDLFDLINVQEFPPEFLEEVVMKEELVRETSFGPMGKVALALAQHCRSLSIPGGKRRKVDKEMDDTGNQTLIAVYRKDNGNLVGFDIDKKSRSKTGKNLFKTNVSSEDFQAAVNIDNRVYVVKGREHKRCTVKAREKNAWKTVKGLDEKPAADAKMVVFLEKIYIIGKEKFWSFNPQMNAWSKRDVPGFSGTRFALCATDLHIFILGGHDTPQRVLIYDPCKPETEKMIDEINSMVHPRRDSAAVATHGKIYVLGGSYNEETRRSVEYYNAKIPSSEWVLIKSNMKFGRYGFAACAHENKIFAIGGKMPAGSTDSIEVYKISEEESNDWEDFTEVVKFQTPFSAFVITPTVSDHVEDPTTPQADQDENSRDYPES